MLLVVARTVCAPRLIVSTGSVGDWEAVPINRLTQYQGATCGITLPPVGRRSIRRSEEPSPRCPADQHG